ncbi:MAG TPA: hypothetical protein VES67_02790 [Vicinamibacterales bacterium]|nr:hypothetical protein [Vicinamibacterales bacterium]
MAERPRDRRWIDRLRLELPEMADHRVARHVNEQGGMPLTGHASSARIQVFWTRSSARPVSPPTLRETNA